MKLFIVAVISFLIFSFPELLRADIYTWVDSNGVKHFSNEPPPEGVKVITKSREIPVDEAKDREREEKDSQAMNELEQQLLKEDTESKSVEKPTPNDDNQTSKIVEIDSGGSTYTEETRRERDRINHRNVPKREQIEGRRESGSDTKDGGTRK